MVDQYLRRCRMTISGGGSAIDVSNMRIKFKITHATTQAPNNMVAFVYNLSKQTRERIMSQKEFTDIKLEAGYEQNSGVIFDGKIIQRISARETPTDTYLAIVAKDGDKGYNYGTINKTLAKGATGKDVFDELAKAMKEHGVDVGFVTKKLAELKFPRPVTMFGMARDYLRSLGLSTGSQWSIQNGKLDMVHKDETKPGGPIVLNSQTGLIGMPLETLNGIYVRCLINPRLTDPVNKEIKIDQKSINRAIIDASYGAAINGEDGTLSKLLGTNDGTYKVLAVDWSGDTRGTDWYADLMCIGSVSGTIPAGQAKTLTDLGPS